MYWKAAALWPPPLISGTSLQVARISFGTFDSTWSRTTPIISSCAIGRSDGRVSCT